VRYSGQACNIMPGIVIK